MISVSFWPNPIAAAAVKNWGTCLLLMCTEYHLVFDFRHKRFEKIRVLMRQEKTMKVRRSNTQRRGDIAICLTIVI